VYLEDAQGFLWEVNLLEKFEKGRIDWGFSGGWRKFAVDHQLEFGDYVILDVHSKGGQPVNRKGGQKAPAESASTEPDASRMRIRVRIFKAKYDGEEDDCSGFDFPDCRGRVVGRTHASETRVSIKSAVSKKVGHPVKSIKAKPKKRVLVKLAMKESRGLELARVAVLMEEDAEEKWVKQEVRRSVGAAASPMDVEIGEKEEAWVEEAAGQVAGAAVGKLVTREETSGGAEVESGKAASARTQVAPALEDEGVRNGGPAQGTELEKRTWDGWTQNAPRSVNRPVPAVRRAAPAVQRVLPAGEGQQEEEGPRRNQPTHEQLGVSGNKASVKVASDAPVKVQPSAKGSKGGMKLAVKKVVKSNAELMRERLSLMMQ
jgi:hypothetical protein